MEFLLVRHAQNVLPATKGPLSAPEFQKSGLTEFGAAQAFRLAKDLSDLPAVQATALFSSPLERCMETAEYLATALKLSAVASTELADRDPGGQQFGTIEDYRQWQLAGWIALDKSTDGSEALESMHKRVDAWVKQVLQTKADRVIAVTHGSVIELVSATLLGMTVQGMRRTFLQCDHASYHHWSLTADENILVRSNVPLSERHDLGSDNYEDIANRIGTGQDASVFVVDKYYVR